MRRLCLLTLAVVLPLSACGSSGSGSGDAASATATPAAPGAGSEPASEAPQCPPAGGTSSRATGFDTAPPMCIDPAKTYTATMQTDVGTITIDLLAGKAPKTVNNFVFLARNHFYDGVTFHRVIQGFMVQGGDPEGTGMGGPGYEFPDELPKAGEYQVGSVAMANAGPNTNGSQFFIVTGAAGVQLPPQYSLFGKVGPGAQGMDTVKKIEADGNAGDGPPKKTHKIVSITVAQK